MLVQIIKYILSQEDNGTIHSVHTYEDDFIAVILFRQNKGILRVELYGFNSNDYTWSKCHVYNKIGKQNKRTYKNLQKQKIEPHIEKLGRRVTTKDAIKYILKLLELHNLPLYEHMILLAS